MAMKLIRGIHNLPQFQQGSAVTIGNFDGMHLGHQQILQQLVSQARQRGVPAVVVLFEPQPLEFLKPETAPARLMPLHDKLAALAQSQVDYCVCLYFNAALAHMSAVDFIQAILVDKLKSHYVLVGDDFHFGYQRQGNFALLQTQAATNGYELVQCQAVQINGERVSSTRIRQALQHANFAEAESLLGRPYALSGRVMHGDKRGRQIGIPTANLRVASQVSALAGVYAVEVQTLAGQRHYGVANLGCRPTVDGQRRFLEVHIFDFAHEIYGQRLQVIFHSKLRNEQRFSSLEELVAQIQQDINIARAFFGLHHD
jgi:riboflavin kinase/FMN adenylyltransferase